MGNLGTPTVLTPTVGSANAATQASHTYPAGDLILVRATCDTSNNGTTVAISNSSTAQTWHTTQQTVATATNGAGCWSWAVSTGFTGTVTATGTSTGGSVPATIAVVHIPTTGNAFSATAPIGNTVAGAISATAFTKTLVTSAANSWSWWTAFNFSRTATATAAASNVIQTSGQGNDGAGDQYVYGVQSSTPTQPTVASGTTLTLGCTFAASAVGWFMGFEVLDPGGSGVTGSAAPAAVVSVGADATVTQFGAAAPAAQVSVGAGGGVAAVATPPPINATRFAVQRASSW